MNPGSKLRRWCFRNHQELIAEAPIGLEGIVAKKAGSPYIEGPTQTWHWQKIKNQNYQRQGKIAVWGR